MHESLSHGPFSTSITALEHKSDSIYHIVSNAFSKVLRFENVNRKVAFFTPTLIGVSLVFKNNVILVSAKRAGDRKNYQRNRGLLDT